MQQNVDVTYRLYDYGRPRELHLEDGVAVSAPRRYDRVPVSVAEASDATLLGPGEAPFTLELQSFGEGLNEIAQGTERWFVPLAGAGFINDEPFEAGQCWLIDGQATLSCATVTRALVAGVSHSPH